MSPHRKGRGWQRFEAYLPVRCTALDPEPWSSRPLQGITEWVSAAGLALRLLETLPIGTPVSIQFNEDEPLRGHIVWCDQRMATPLGTTVPHRVAFENPIDPALIQQWLSHAPKSHEPRIPLQFPVKFESVEEEMVGQGMCLDLSRGGMFISTNIAAPQGAEILLHFKLPRLSYTLCVLAQVMWRRTKELMAVDRGEIWPSATPGMGVRFLEVNPLDAALISTFINRLCSVKPEPPDSSSSDGEPKITDTREPEASPHRTTHDRDRAD